MSSSTEQAGVKLGVQGQGGLRQKGETSRKQTTQGLSWCKEIGFYSEGVESHWKGLGGKGQICPVRFIKTISSIHCRMIRR